MSRNSRPSWATRIRSLMTLPRRTSRHGSPRPSYPPQSRALLVAPSARALSEAVRELSETTHLPVLLGVFGPGAMGDAVAPLREGFYDCVPSPLGSDDALERCPDALAARRHYRTRSSADGNALANVL